MRGFCFPFQFFRVNAVSLSPSILDSLLMESEKLSQIPEHNPAYPVDLLIPCARNARTHSEAQIAQIAASIREFGFTNPVLIDGNDGIIAGHGRVLAAMKLGMHTVPVIRLAYL